MNETMFSLIKLNSATQSSKVDNLTSRVESLESDVEFIADQTGIDTTETELSRFLGNTEAQLVDLQTDPEFDPSGLPTIAPETFDDITPDEADLLGGALYSINKRNEILSSQVAALQEEVEAGDTGGGAPTQSETVLLQNRLNQLERIVVNSQKSQRGSLSSSFGGINNPALSARGHQVSSDGLNNEEQEILTDMIDDVRGGAVSMFSVAKTGSLEGLNNVPQSIHYEKLLANKGGVYHSENGTFVTVVAGYYFITFTARTYDHKYLGINLMKNDETLTAIFSDKHKRSVMQTQSIITHLAVGDHLWLRMPPSELFAIHSDQYHLSTFTGFLLYPGDP